MARAAGHRDDAAPRAAPASGPPGSGGRGAGGAWHSGSGSLLDAVGLTLGRPEPRRELEGVLSPRPAKAGSPGSLNPGSFLVHRPPRSSLHFPSSPGATAGKAASDPGFGEVAARPASPQTRAARAALQGWETCRSVLAPGSEDRHSLSFGGDRRRLPGSQSPASARGSHSRVPRSLRWLAPPRGSQGRL
ncbi:hypothetical protein NN561_019535 [Cricetulus griseus]